MRAATAAAACIAILGTAGTAVAAPPPKVPGTPGDANCHGKTTAFAAQLGKQDNILRERGIGQLAKFSDISVNDVKAFVDTVCGTP